MVGDDSLDHIFRHPRLPARSGESDSTRRRSCLIDGRSRGTRRAEARHSPPRGYKQQMESSPSADRTIVARADVARFFVHKPSYSLLFDHKMTLLPPSREMNLGRRKRGEPKLSQSFSSCRILAGCPTETDCMESMRVPLCPEIPKFRKSSKHGGAAHSALAESRVRLILYHPYADFELRRSGRSATAYTSCFSTTHKTRASERAGGRHID